MPREKAPEAKSNVLTIIAVIAAVILGIAFFMARNKAAGEREEAAKTITGLSNDVAQARATLDETRKVVATMSTTLTARGEELAALSNQLVAANTQLTNATDNLKLVTDNLNKVIADANANSQTALDEIKKRDQSIKALLDERGELEKRLLTLNSNVGLYDAKFAEMQKQLAAAEKAGQAKTAEIERLNTLRVFWENQFNDPAKLQARLAVLKTESARPASSTNLLDRVNLDLELLPSGNVRLVGPAKK